MKKKKQADLLLLERSKRPGRIHKLRAGRPLSFIGKVWPSVAISVLIYAVLVNHIGWVVPSGIAFLVMVIVWASCQEE